MALTVVLATPSSASAAGSWTTGGPYGGDIVSIEVAPSNPAILYAGSSHSGVFRSTNGGDSWSVAGSQLVHMAGVLIIDPTTAATVYVVNLSSSLFKSTDGGNTWAYISGTLPPPSPNVYALAIDPSAPSTLYAGTGSGVFKSTDAGDSWVMASAGLTNQDTRALAVDAATPATLYAGTGGGVFRSTNAGASWSPANAGLPSAVTFLVVDPTETATVYAGAGALYKSTDAGGSWARADAGLPSPSRLVIDPSGSLLAGTSAGVFRSTNGGGSWSALGPARRQVAALAVTSSAPTRIYAGTDRGIFRSTDAGGSWLSTNTGLTAIPVTTLVIDPLAPSTLYAGADQQSGGFKSTNGGLDWLPCDGRPPAPIAFLAVAPTVPATVYASTGDSRLSRSTDGGASWTLADTGLPLVPWTLAVDPSAPTTVYAAGGGHVYKSTDAGASWSFSGAGLPGGAFQVLVVDRAVPGTLYVTGQMGVYKSTDAGASWLPRHEGLPTSPEAGALALDPVAPDTVLALVGGAAVPAIAAVIYRSTDGGESWTMANSGLQTPAWVAVLVAQPLQPAAFYAVMYNGRIYASTNRGASWTRVHGTPPNVTTLVADPTGATIYAATARGVWQASPPAAGFVKSDMDGDGQPDLVFHSTLDGARNKAWLMNGVARAAEANITPDAASADWLVRGADDYNDDGANDLVFWNSSTGQVEFWMMNGTARSGPPVPLTGSPALGTDWELAATGDFTPWCAWCGPSLVWHGSASQEIVIWVMEGVRKAWAIIPTPNQAVEGNWGIVAARDYNDDGNTDFLWYNSTSGKIVTWYMDAEVVRTSGQFTTPPNAGDSNWKVVASADFSGATGPGTPPLGSPDIVWRNETSGNQVVWHMDFASRRVRGEFTSPAANTPALDWTIVGPR